MGSGKLGAPEGAQRDFEGAPKVCRIQKYGKKEKKKKERKKERKKEKRKMEETM